MDEGKKKRKPSEYNLHMKECMPRKAKEAGMPKVEFAAAPKLMKACAVEYKKKQGG